MVRSAVPSATVSRLPVYLRCLSEFPSSQDTCSSEQLADAAGVNSAQVRKDLSYLGSHGVRGVGYHVAELRVQIRRALGLTHPYGVAIVGAGNLGTALSTYPGFDVWGFHVAVLADVDPAKVGTKINDIEVVAVSDLEEIVAERDIAIGIIATPAHAAQEVADVFVAAGVRSILNFAPAILRTPAGTMVRRVDLSTELQILSFHLRDADRG